MLFSWLGSSFSSFRPHWSHWSPLGDHPIFMTLVIIWGYSLLIYCLSLLECQLPGGRNFVSFSGVPPLPRTVHGFGQKHSASSVEWLYLAQTTCKATYKVLRTQWRLNCPYRVCRFSHLCPEKNCESLSHEHTGWVQMVLRHHGQRGEKVSVPGAPPASLWGPVVCSPWWDVTNSTNHY